MSTISSIQVNGKVQDVDLPISLMDLIKRNNVTQPDMVSVQINGEFVNRENFHTTPINANDEVDFLYFMGGGSRC
jgi:sulfur carrier protein